MLDVVLGQQFRQFGLEGLELAELFDVGELHGLDGAVFGFGEDQHVDDADDPAVDQREQLCRPSRR